MLNAEFRRRELDVKQPARRSLGEGGLGVFLCQQRPWLPCWFDLTPLSVCAQEFIAERLRSTVNCRLIRYLTVRIGFAAIVSALLNGSQLTASEPDYLVYVSNERSGDISIIDPAQ